MRLQELVSVHYEELNSSHKHIWKYIDNNKEICANMSIENLADCCNVSRSTVMRFAQKIGLTGYSELKTYLRWEVSEFVDSKEDFVKIISQNSIKTIERFRDMDISQICKLLYKANRIFVYGTGSLQKAAASEFKRMMLSLNIIVENITGEGEFRKELRLISSQDVILIISKKGESEFIKEMLIQLKNKSVPVISLAFSGNNTLSNMSDYNLFLTHKTVSIKKDLDYESMCLIFPAIEILCVKFMQYMRNMLLSTTHD